MRVCAVLASAFTVVPLASRPAAVRDVEPPPDGRDDDGAEGGGAGADDGGTDEADGGNASKCAALGDGIGVVFFIDGACGGRCLRPPPLLLLGGAFPSTESSRCTPRYC